MSVCVCVWGGGGKTAFALQIRYALLEILWALDGCAKRRRRGRALEGDAFASIRGGSMIAIHVAVSAQVAVTPAWAP